MALTKKGDKVLRAMRKEYGKKRGTSVFYASIHKGRILGTHRSNNWHERLAQRKRRKYGRKVFKNRYERSKFTRKHRQNISRALKQYHKSKRRR